MKKAQSLVEFVALLPVFMFILYVGVKIMDVALKAQKLEMASYYAARLYAKNSVSGVKRGTAITLQKARKNVLDDIVKRRVYAYLNTKDVVIKNDGKKIYLEWEIPISIGVAFLKLKKKIKLKASGEMEDDPFTYGGGRNADE